MKAATLDHVNRGPDNDDGDLRLDPDSVLANLNQPRASEAGATNGSASDGCHGFRLAPKRPPGRWHGKARAFAGEIGRLHAEGYTFEAIREALAEAGVMVSNSTVQREVARFRRLSKPAATLEIQSLPG